MTIASGIAESDPERTRIELAIARAFADLPGGPWTVLIDRPDDSAEGPACAIRIIGRTSIRAGSVRSFSDVGRFLSHATQE